MDSGGHWCPYWTTTWFCSGGILLWGPNGASLLAVETTSLLNNRWPLGLLAFSFLCLCTAFWSAERSQSIAYQRVWDSHKLFRLLLSVVCIFISFLSSIGLIIVFPSSFTLGTLFQNQLAPHHRDKSVQIQKQSKSNLINLHAQYPPYLRKFVLS